MTDLSHSERLIAENILLVVCDGKKSNISVFFDAAGGALLSFSKDIGYLAYDFFSTDDRYRNFDDRVRLFETLKDQDLKKIIEIVVKAFFKKTKRKGWAENIVGMTGKLVGMHVVNKAFLDDFAEVFVAKFVAKILVKVSFNFIVSTGAMSSRAIYVSRELAEKCPEVYAELKANGSLDLFYFLVEEYCNPFLDAIMLSEKDPDAFERVVDLISVGMLERGCTF